MTLANNYIGMQNFLRLVTTLPNLAGITHVSTAFVNSCHPFLPDGTVQEEVYPLKFGDLKVCLQPS